MSEWDDLKEKYKAGGGAAPVDDWADLKQKYTLPKAEPQTQQAVPRQGNPLTNFAQGFNQGIAGVAGMPVDTLMNVADLATAGYGALKGALGGKDLPEVSDRKNIVGSSEWILNKLRGVAPTIADPAAPSSGWAALGRGTGAALPFTNPAASIPKQLAMGAASGLGSQIGQDIGGTQGAIIGGMLPGMAASAIPMGIRAAVRGTSGDQMAQNIADLKAAGVDSPSVGLASGNSGLRALENTMARVPVSGGVLRENMQNAQNQLQRTANDTRDALSQRYGPLAAGNAIDKGIAEFAAQKQAKASSLYDQINIPWTSQFQTPALMNAVTDMTRPIPGAPAISTGILGKDSGLPALLKNQFNADQAATVGVPYQAIKEVRSNIGERIPQQIWDRSPGIQQTRGIYAALSEDLQNAAAKAGQSQQFNRANDYFRGMTNRIDAVTPFADKAAPEASYLMFKSATRNSGSEAAKLVRTLPEAQRKVLAATAIDEMGTSIPSKQDGTGARFSSETFLTNWNKLDNSSKNALFGSSISGSQVRKNLDKIATASSLMRDQASVLGNSSGTGGAVGYASGLAGAGAVGAAVASGNYWALAPAATAAFSLYGGAKALTNPQFVAWLAKSTEINPRNQAAYMARLGSIIQQTKDPEEQKQMLNYYNALP